MYREKEGETEIEYRETWNSTTVTLVLLRARSTTPIHGIAILRPHPLDDDEYDGYIKRLMMWEPAPGIEPGSSAWEARRVNARPPQLPPYQRREVEITCMEHKISFPTALTFCVRLTARHVTGGKSKRVYKVLKSDKESLVNSFQNYIYL